MSEASTSGTKDHYGHEIDLEGREIKVHTVSWADIVDSDHSDHEAGSEGEDHEIPDTVKYVTNPIFQVETTVHCKCLNPINVDSALRLLQSLVEVEFDSTNFNCILDNCVRSLNFIFRVESDIIISANKVAATDFFFRFRHDYLYRALCLAYNLPQNKSDIKFSDFGVFAKKDRTPDLILNLKGKIFVIEVTAASSLERAAQSKGIESLGFESKYKAEIEIMNEMGLDNLYVPIFFDMSDPNATINRAMLKPLDENLVKNLNRSNDLRILSKSLASITNEFKKYFILSANILFSDNLEVVGNHPQHEFLYEISDKKQTEVNFYKPFTVSSPVYNKISNNWDRLLYIIENSKVMLDQTACFYVSTNNRKISFESNPNGLLIPEWVKMIENVDKLTFFKKLKLKMGSKIVSATDSESGLTFYDKAVNDTIVVPEIQISSFTDHPTVDFEGLRPNISKIDKKCFNYTSTNYHSVHYDKDYEDTIIKSILDCDKQNKENGKSYNLGTVEGLLGKLEASEIKIDKVLSDATGLYRELNSDSGLPLKIFKMKSPFILPIASIFSNNYADLKYKNVNLIKKVIQDIQFDNPYTTLILENVIDPKFELYSKPKLPSKDLQNLITRRAEISSSINYLQKELSKTGTGEKISKTTNKEFSLQFKDLKEESKRVGSLITKRQKEEGVKNQTSLIRLPTKSKNSDLRKRYEKEMLHFNNKKSQSTIEGVGIRKTLEEDYLADSKVFHSLTSFFCQDSGPNPDPFIDFQDVDDVRLLKDLKKCAQDDYAELINSVTRSQMGHASALISRLAHSLLYYSQMPFDSQYIKVDNLGYNNVIVIVKGGKKIFKSKSSKLFRILYPVPVEILDWYTCGHRNKGSNKVIEFEERFYILTPWHMLHESILTDSVSFYPRICSFAVLNSKPELKFKDQINRLSMNITLAFHNRRQTESLLANLRYILLSTLGDYTGVEYILKEFFGFNYDCFQSYVRGCILFKYGEYFNSFVELKESKKSIGKDITIADFHKMELKNIFTGDILSTQDDLALMIYSTFLMTKAPYQRAVERSNNLKGILSIHQLYEETVGVNLSPEMQLEKLAVENKGCLNEYCDELFKNDFSFDPKFCALVGNFISSVLIGQGDEEDIQNKWIKIMNSTWDDMATSTGLRGDYKTLEDFWGQKGYFVVYRQMLTTPNFARTVKELFSSNITDDSKRKILRELNKSFFTESSKVEQEFLLFHAVDKVQWRGGREIYVMDISTKTLQQPIEKFMGELCKKLSNELISIPSDRRAQVIHHSIFEKDLPLKDTLTWYLTLDCTKWAPKSVFSKFAIMLMNMPCIPPSFITYFLNYIEKLYKKRIYFNQQEVEVLKNNSLYTKIVDNHLKFDSKVSGYYLLMPYSWVMGIFNYTSSFMHAANQSYFSYLLLKTSVISYKEETTMVMFAHSDDSGGRLTAPNEIQASRALQLYEVFLKSCNHLLSKKKSVVSRIYFEILSVIYMFNQLLSLLPKFLGGIRFLPTDKGPSQDILQSYSKCIEVMVAGASFSVAYIVMKIYSMLVWRFYANRKVLPTDYKRPLQYFGMPDAHPLMVLLCGSDADTLRIMPKKEDLKGLMAFCRSVMDTSWEEGPIKPLKFEIKVRGIKKGFEDYMDLYKDILNSWSIRNVNYHSSAMNTLSFLRKLNDAGFVGSLVNESVTRRMSRSFFLRSGCSLKTKVGNIYFKDYLDSVTLLQLSQEDNNGSPGDVNEILSKVLGEGDFSILKSDYESQKENQEVQYKILSKTLQSPLKVCEYLNEISLENRRIMTTFRTLKPTLVQLVKTAKVFSTDFDPASLVSYIKEPDMRWALNNTRGLLTAETELRGFCEKMKIDIDEVEPDNLLRICRTYGKDNTKSIYMYSKVPTDLRQIKSYSAFLTFLSVNSINGKEIQGLVLKLTNKDLGREYLEMNINSEMYLINNCISLLNVMIDKSEIEFIKNLNIKPIQEIGWSSGTVSEFINFISEWEFKDIHYTLLQPQICFLKYKLGLSGRSCSPMLGGSYYTFLKAQKLKSGWYGKGQLYISIMNNFFLLDLENSRAVSIKTNFTGRMDTLIESYIIDVMLSVGLDINCLRRPVKKTPNQYCFGFDNAGRMCVLPFRECETGIPSTFKVNPGGFVEQIEYYCFKSMYKDHLIIETGEGAELRREKIYFLPIKRAELVALIPRIFYKEEFELKLTTLGLNNFEEFIMTEIMTEYGTGIYIDFEKMMDNYSSARLYSIFKSCRDHGYSKIPNSINIRTLPAAEGSLIRILIDYSDNSKDSVVKTPTNLNPVLMQLRSEYPETMSVILAEKLVECHKDIYTISEVKEISDSYSEFSESTDIEKARSALIKLMTYWGYGSMVNSLDNFTLARSFKNYAFFSCNIMDSKYIKHYDKVFTTLINSINSAIEYFSPEVNKLNLEIPILKINCIGYREIINNFVRTICLELYSFTCLSAGKNLSVLMYYNLLLAMLDNEEFCAILQEEMSKNYILGSILVNPRNKFNFIILINNLRFSWSRNNTVRHRLNYNVQLERLPFNVPNPRSFMNQFKNTIPPRDIYYHGSVSQSLLADLMCPKEFEVDGKVYMLTFSLAKLSTQSVPTSTVLKFKRPLTSEYLDSEDGDELISELCMGDPDIDTIMDLWGNADRPYIKSSIRRYTIKNKSVLRAHIVIIIEPQSSSCNTNQRFYRQTGENLMVLSDTYFSSFVNFNYNVNVKLACNSKTNPTLIYTSVCDELNKREVLSKFVPGVEFKWEKDYSSILRDNLVRDCDGVIKPTVSCGYRFDEKLSETKDIVRDEYGVVKLVDKPDVVDELSRPIETESQYSILMDSIEALERKGLSREAVDKLKERYFGKAASAGLSLEIIMQSIFKGGTLMLVHEEANKDLLNITPDQSKKMFLSPESFGMVSGTNKPDSNSIKDKKAKAEIDSFHPSLSEKIGSCTLRISKDFLKIVKSNYKMWKIVYKNTRHKRENKNYLITLLLSIVNNANCFDDNRDDHIWQSIINKGSIYMSQDEEEDEDDSVFDAIFNSIPASRLRYSAMG